jgi:DNA-binding MarR family transcriptional regulator
MSRQDKLTPQAAAQGPEGPDDDFMMEVNLRLRLDEAVDLEAELLRIRARRQPSQKELRRLARKIYDARRLRDRLLDKELFGEPAWDMLLALYHLPALGHMLTTTGLCCCCPAPPTTALRWVNTLVAQRLIERGPHLKDGRMHLVRLTDEGRALLDQYLARLLHYERAAPLGRQLLSGLSKV